MPFSIIANPALTIFHINAVYFHHVLLKRYQWSWNTPTSFFVDISQWISCTWALYETYMGEDTSSTNIRKRPLTICRGGENIISSCMKRKSSYGAIVSPDQMHSLTTWNIPDSNACIRRWCQHSVLQDIPKSRICGSDNEILPKINSRKTL